MSPIDDLMQREAALLCRARENEKSVSRTEVELLLDELRRGYAKVMARNQLNWLCNAILLWRSLLYTTFGVVSDILPPMPNDLLAFGLPQSPEPCLSRAMGSDTGVKFPFKEPQRA